MQYITDEQFKLLMLRGDIKQNLFDELHRLQNRNKSIEEQIAYALGWFERYIDETQCSHYGALTLCDCLSELQRACDEMEEAPDKETIEYYGIRLTIDPEVVDVVALLIYRLAYMLTVAT